MHGWRRLSWVVLVGLLACSSSSPSGDPPAGKNGPSDGYVFGGARPVSIVRVPDGYEAGTPAPLVLLLHGYGANATIQDLYFNLSSIADGEGFFIVAPEGSVDSRAKQFWNANEACCAFDDTSVDDVRYLTELLDEVGQYYSIDPKRTFVLGHSNGGAMAMTMGCRAADRIAAVVDLAGPFFDDPASCKPSSPVGLLHMHGTKDTVIPFEKGPLPDGVHPSGTGRPMPGAVGTVAAWAGYNGCAPTPDTSTPPIDLDADIAGAETKLSTYTGCAANGAVELWSLEGSGHVPLNLSRDLPNRIYGFMKAHAKP